MSFWIESRKLVFFLEQVVPIFAFSLQGNKMAEAPKEKVGKIFINNDQKKLVII